ncbi:unnamed protein product [Spirodela intermedia]|uniref:Uncharacterized protein n=1 Tax=Spirodela intermedia TaxID=51605 RepID=A0A7I8KVI1_SPIIN|nr:unnamed protein product [Spirodela intermedia]
MGDSEGEEGKHSPLEGGEVEGKLSSSSFPLFAVSNAPPAVSGGTSEAPLWLRNPSFTADISAISRLSGAATETSFRPPYDGDEEEEEAEVGGAGGGAPSTKSRGYELVGSSSVSSEERRSEKKKKKKKKRRTREGEERRHVNDDSRRTKVRPWAGAQSTKPIKEYYIDISGDPDNLVFGSLYRMDVARYKIQNLWETPNLHLQALYRKQLRDSYLDAENDLDVLDSKSKAAGRYCSTKYSALERHKGFKRVKLVSNEKCLAVPSDFIPLVEPEVTHERYDSEMVSKTEIEESWEDEMIRRTREFNKKTRDFPHDERIWMEFADFQDKISRTQPQKAARLQTLEKKISILEKAVELNPENEELLLSLLHAYQKRDNGDVLIERWVKILMHHSGSYRLWIEFLHVCQADFSKFKVTDIRKTYAHAIQAVSSACNKLCRQIRQTAKSERTDPDLVQLEYGLVDIFISLCRFEWQSGFRELATGLFQAEIEYSLFCPSLLLSIQNKQRLFEHFWNGDGARVGEDGALGWSGWLEKEEESRQNVMEDIDEETEGGGWSGWYKPSPKNEEITKNPDNSAEDIHGDLKIEEDLEMEDAHQEEDVESLLRKLGIDPDTEPQNEVSDSATWNRWSKEEASRESAQWMPVRENSGSGHPGDPDGESNEQLSRVILFEDIQDYIFSLYSEEARFRLVTRFIDFYGGKVSQWACTNSASWIEDTLSLDTTPTSILNVLGDAPWVASEPDSDSIHYSLKLLLDSEADILRKGEIMKFLRNGILLCTNSFPRNYILEEALLLAEELSMTQANCSTSSDTPSRPLAKRLLKNDRQDLLLCGVYAKREAAHGNTDLARKVFDMALLSVGGLAPALQGNAPFLFFWYADMEMTDFVSSGSEICHKRAIHILSHLGCGAKYEPFKGQPSGPLLLRARQGFKEQIRSLRPLWAHGDVKNEAVALLCSASLFEMLTIGLDAGDEVIEEAFSMVLPERRAQSLQLESLSTYFIGLLLRHRQRLTLSRVWRSISRGLQTYPHNPKLSSAMVEISGLFTVRHRIRRTFDELCHRNPSVVVFLFALSFELGRDGSQHRIRGLFERALSDDRLQRSVLLWRCYLAYEAQTAQNPNAVRRVFYRSIHACPWSKVLWLDGFLKLSSILTARELADLQEVMRDKELNLRTDIYEILLEDEH